MIAKKFVDVSSKDEISEIWYNPIFLAVFITLNIPLLVSTSFTGNIAQDFSLYIRIFCLILLILLLFRGYWLSFTNYHILKNLVLCANFIVLPAYFLFSQKLEFLWLNNFIISALLFCHFVPNKVFFYTVIPGTLLGIFLTWLNGEFSAKALVNLNSETANIIEENSAAYVMCISLLLLWVIDIQKDNLNKINFRNLEMLASSIAHEIRGPLTLLSFNIARLEAYNGIQNILTSMKKEISRCHTIISSILKMVKNRNVEVVTAVSLRSILNETVSDLN